MVLFMQYVDISVLEFKYCQNSHIVCSIHLILFLHRSFILWLRENNKNDLYNFVILFFFVSDFRFAAAQTIGITRAFPATRCVDYPQCVRSLVASTSNDESVFLVMFIWMFYRFLAIVKITQNEFHPMWNVTEKWPCEAQCESNNRCQSTNSKRTFCDFNPWIAPGELLHNNFVISTANGLYDNGQCRSNAD